MPIGEPEAPIQVVQPAAAELVNSLEAKAGQFEEMVTKCTMTIDRFLPSTHPTTQP